jgi:antirestriction protein ArdC
MEELIAELGSAFLTDHCGLPGVLHHASYIDSWLQALRNDKRLIFTAASQAQKAADYLLAPLALETPSMQADTTQAIAA